MPDYFDIHKDIKQKITIFLTIHDKDKKNKYKLLQYRWKCFSTTHFEVRFRCIGK